MQGLPLYIQVRDNIRDGIQTRRIVPNSDGVLPSQDDFAKMYKVSLTTIKKAIGDLERDGLVESRRGKGLLIKADNSNPVATVPASTDCLHIGIGFSDALHKFNNPFAAEVVRGIEHFNHECDMVCHIITFPGLELDFQPENQLIRFPLSGLNGILLLSPVSAYALSCIKSQRIPFVMAGTHSIEPDVVCFMGDNGLSTFTITDAVLKRGLKKNVIYVGNPDKTSACLKEAGYKLAYRHHGLQWNSDGIIYEDYDLDAARKAIDLYIKENGVPEAILGYDDIMAADISDHLKGKGISGILMCGSGNIESLSEKIDITMDNKLFDLGYNACKVLYGMIKGIPPSKTKFFSNFELIER